MQVSVLVHKCAVYFVFINQLAFISLFLDICNQFQKDLEEGRQIVMYIVTYGSYTKK